MKKNIIIGITILLGLFLTACGAGNTDKDNNNTSGNDGNQTNVEKDNNGNVNQNSADATLTINHELGETTVAKKPEKIVVFDFGVLDSLDKLGIDVAGVAKGSNLPSYLDKFNGDDYENVGSLKEPDFEKISEIDPDVIFISGRQSDVYDELSKLGPTIYLGVDQERYMDSFTENMTVIGEIFDKEDTVKEELDKINESIETIKEKAQARDEKALIILANDDKISAYGPNSRFGIIHDVFGVPAVDEGIETSTHGSNVTFEYVMEQNPDLLYVVDRSAAIGEEPAAKKIVENKLVENTNAYKNDQITYLNPEVWYLSGGGLVSVTEMVNEISASLE